MFLYSHLDNFLLNGWTWNDWMPYDQKKRKKLLFVTVHDGIYIAWKHVNRISSTYLKAFHQKWNKRRNNKKHHQQEAKWKFSTFRFPFEKHFYFFFFLSFSRNLNALFVDFFGSGFFFHLFSMEMSVNNFSKDTYFFCWIRILSRIEHYSDPTPEQSKWKVMHNWLLIFFSVFFLSFFLFLIRALVFVRFFFDKTLASFSCQYSIYLLPFDLVVNTQNVGQGTAAPKPISSRMSVLCMWCCGWTVFSM